MTGPDAQANVFAMRMWKSLLATQELLSAYLGVRLGLYDVLAAAEKPLAAAEVAARAGVAVRYAREWLEQQAVASILTVDDVRAQPDQRRYALPEAHAEVLTISDSPASMASLAVLPLGGIAAALPALLSAYRSGDGVPDSVFGLDWREGHSGANRSLFTHQLAGWIKDSMPDVHEQLSGPGRRIADVACGAGWSSIALALAYPQAQVNGLDFDAEAIADARRNASQAGVQDRVHFEARDAAGPALAGEYDLVCLFDALHEISHPVAVLRACRALRSPQGTVLVMDAKVATAFTAPGDDVERFQYCTSVLHCLPAALVGGDSTGTGTVLRPQLVRTLAKDAGFSGMTILPATDGFHRLYRLAG
ncbi:MAG TPA: SAM-dependent methyltransferase [Micromonosporaceae bacterium]|nr:SAM-dependent methyltransferase [Micromonosporaceae bacterium]